MAVFSVSGKPWGAAVAGRQQGFTYMGALMLIALMGTALAAVGQVWSTVGTREREVQNFGSQ